MVSLMAFCKDIEELVKVQEASKINAALVSEDKWIMNFFNRIEDVKKKINENPLLDIICFDLEQNQGISYATYLRKCYEKAYMILMAHEDMSPMDYIRPDIMPSGLIIQPASKEDVNKVIHNVFETYVEKMKSRQEGGYIVETKEGRVHIPYDKISYFEARNKKIYIRYNDKEIGFYSTMNQVEDEVTCEFVRIHRSFMVNRDYIRKIKLSHNFIELKDDMIVPISRSYRAIVKELCNGR